MSNRVIYQSQAVFVGPSPASGTQATVNIKQIHRVTQTSNSFSIARQDVNQFGQLAAIDRIIINAPTVNFEMSYNVADVTNEDALGFDINTNASALSGIIAGVEDSKNYWVRLVPEGNDAAGYAGTDGGAIGFGNGFISSWSTQGAVGSLPTTSVRVDAANMKFDPVSSGIITPAVNPTDGLSLTGITVVLPTATSGYAGQVTALQPGNITVSIGTAGLGIQNKCIQSYNIGVEFRRESLQCLGSRFPFAKLITFPVNVSFDIEADVQSLTSGNLSDILCNDQSYDLSVSLYKPTCTGNGQLAAQYTLKGGKLESQNYTSSIGPNTRVSMRFLGQVGGPQDTARGLFINGLVQS